MDQHPAPLCYKEPAQELWHPKPLISGVSDVWINGVRSDLFHSTSLLVSPLPPRLPSTTGQLSSAQILENLNSVRTFIKIIKEVKDKTMIIIMITNHNSSLEKMLNCSVIAPEVCCVSMTVWVCDCVTCISVHPYLSTADTQLQHLSQSVRSQLQLSVLASQSAPTQCL